MIQRLLFRYLRLNARKPRASKDGTKQAKPANEMKFPALQDMVEEVWEKYPTVGSRHAPALPKEGGAKQGVRYIVPLARKKGAAGSVLLRVCVYTAGEVPAFAPSDMNASEATVEYATVADQDGRTLSPGIEFSVLLFGRVALIQNRTGAAAASSIEKMIHSFGRMLYGHSFVKPDFLQISPKSVANQIKKAGGIRAVNFNAAHVTDENGEAIRLDRILELEEQVGARKSRVSLLGTKEEPLDEEASLALLEHPGDEGIENVSLTLVDGEVITGEQMVLSKTVTVGLANGVPDCDQVDTQLVEYLKDLMKVNKGEQMVSKEGKIGGELQLVGIRTRKNT